MTAPPAVLVPLQQTPEQSSVAAAPVAGLPVPDVRDTESHLTVWIQATNVTNDTRRGLNQALTHQLVAKSGTKDNRPSTLTKRHRGENKFEVQVTIPAGIDRTHVMNLLRIIASNTPLLHGLTTPVMQTVDA